MALEPISVTVGVGGVSINPPQRLNPDYLRAVLKREHSSSLDVVEVESAFESFSVGKNVGSPAFSVTVFILSSVGRANRADEGSPDVESPLVEVALVLSPV